LQFFALMRTERNVELVPGQIRWTYDCRFEPSLVQAHFALLDADGDGTASEHERGAFCLSAAQYLRDDLFGRIDDAQMPISEESFYMFDDGDGFRSVLVSNLPVSMQHPMKVEFMDPAFIPPAGTSAADVRTTTGLVSCEIE